MEYRELGKTGLKTSLLGFGGFHLLEIPQSMANKLLNSYLDLGGNYIETAATYGDGESERKIGMSVSGRRREYILASKVRDRSEDGARSQIERSLRNLKTDYLDILFIHELANPKDLQETLEGAYQAALEAQRAGKVRHIAASMHGCPEGLIAAVEQGGFDVIMASINYYDRCNYPEIEGELLPKAHEKEMGVMLMKPLSDGYLHKNADLAFRYAFSKPVSVVVTGMNNEKMLANNIKRAENFIPMTIEEETKLFLTAPELSDYVCRQCGSCSCPNGIDIKEVFAAEGYFDRQMARGIIDDTAEYALMERLRFWYGDKELGLNRFKKLEVGVEACNNCGSCLSLCPYKIDIPNKLVMADYKLGDRDMY
jgi:predicted aldo/keto reductase-like oxidoreductase